MNTTTRKVLFGVMLAGVAFAGSVEMASAHGGRSGGPVGNLGPAGMDFATLDADGDGLLTQVEMQAIGKTRFDASDTDASGTLDKDEMMAQVSAMIDKRRGGCEDRGEGAGGFAEMRLNFIADRILGRMDKNDDDVLSMDEMQPPTDRMGGFIERFDSDDDGALSEDEFAAAGERSDRHGRKPQGNR